MSASKWRRPIVVFAAANTFGIGLEAAGTDSYCAAPRNPSARPSPGDVLCGHEFADVLSSDGNGSVSVGLTHLPDVTRLPRTGKGGNDSYLYLLALRAQFTRLP